MENERLEEERLRKQEEEYLRLAMEASMQDKKERQAQLNQYRAERKIAKKERRRLEREAKEATAAAAEATIFNNASMEESTPNSINTERNSISPGRNVAAAKSDIEPEGNGRKYDEYLMRKWNNTWCSEHRIHNMIC